MKKLLLISFLGIFLLSLSPVSASNTTNIEHSVEIKGKKTVKVKSYKKKNGTTVKSHKRSKPKR